MNIPRILCLLLLSSISFAEITDFLHVEGRSVVDDQVQPVILRGVNMDAQYWAFQWDTLAPMNYADESDIQYLDSLGANVIRLCLHWRYFNSNYGFNFIDNYLQWCDSAGIYVVLDMHAVPPDMQFGDNGTWDDTLAQAQLATLWKNIAARYVNRPVVAGYDLMNEPNPPDSMMWWNLAERITDSIRTVDSTHIIFVEETMNHSMFRTIDDDNVVYSFHDYSPFSVSHAGAQWVGDSPMTDDYYYPGTVLANIDWVAYSQDGEVFFDQTSSWLYWDSGDMIVPANANFATIKPSCWGNVGNIWFDDVAWTKNGVAQPVVNAGMEDESWNRPGNVANWYFQSSGPHAGEWDAVARTGLRSLRITGDQDGWAVWSQAQWLIIEPLIPVVPGDTIRNSGWILAPTNNGGGIYIGCDYFHGVYDYYDRAHCASDIAPYIEWSAAHNVPIWCGEFGSMSSAPGNSCFDLVRDKIGVMNDASIGWTMWSYRSDNIPAFALVFGDSVVAPLAEILFHGCDGETWRVSDLTAVRDGVDMLLRWSEIPGAISYRIYSADTPSDDLSEYTIIGTSAANSYRHLNGLSAPRKYYQVIPSFPGN